MARRPKFKRSIKRGRICDWPEGVGTPDEVAARATSPFPETDHVYLHHLIGARTTADLFGIAEPKEFDAGLQRAANGASRQGSAGRRRKPAKGQ
jgi:hypothetical protein